jgi:diaminohydroxyphosphoribosylaminopyrimidine deaminase/5-amino-6-(5-phosphoribosylamino)uracil reductase
MDDLYKRKVQSLIIEGGSQTLNSFIELNLWDEARVFVAEKLFGDGIAAPLLSREPNQKYSVQGDTLMFYNR